MHDLNEVDLLNVAVVMADAVSDGHLAILKFTTGWKVTFGTPDRQEISELQSFESLTEALTDLLTSLTVPA
jgi:hypothetical protein